MDMTIKTKYDVGQTVWRLRQHTDSAGRPISSYNIERLRIDYMQMVVDGNNIRVKYQAYSTNGVLQNFDEDELYGDVNSLFDKIVQEEAKHE